MSRRRTNGRQTSKALYPFDLFREQMPDIISALPR
jgi:hypothetical protein